MSGKTIYRQPIVTVLGHVDSGKCISCDSLVLTNLNYIPAKELYYLIDPSTENVLSYSLDIWSLKIRSGLITHKAKRSVSKMLRIILNDETEITTTPEHKFLTVEDRFSGTLKYIRAIDLLHKVNYRSAILAVNTKVSKDRFSGYFIPVIEHKGIQYLPIERFGLAIKYIKKIRVVRGNFNVYDFKVEHYNNYIVNDVIVHNTTLLDKIRGTAVQLREAGGITQHIGASLFPKETVELMCGPLLKKYNFQLRVPGLLIIDTPGHEVFTNLRRRGGSAADIAILLVDVNKGFQPQTHECMQILISRKVPFLVAANKIDLIPGWRSIHTYSIIDSLNSQSSVTLATLEERIASIIASLSTYKFDADRFDRIRDFKRTVAIVPVSAKTGEGIQELMTVLVGLVQRFMLDRLKVDIEKPGQGIILEVTRESGFGTILRAIHLDGMVRKGDYIIAMSPDGPIISKIRAILMPAPLDEIRDPRKKFKSVDESYPAAGIIISAPDIENVYAGSPFYAVSPNLEYEDYVKSVVEEVKAIKIDTDKIGVIIKADTLGSLEALIDYCKRRGIPIRKGDVGPISKKDVVDASVVKIKDEIRGVILGFNVDIHEDAEELARDKDVLIFRGNILYRIVDDYLNWVNKYIEEKRHREFESLILPGRIQVLEGYVFRHSKPAIVGVKVLAGRIKPKYPLITLNGTKVGHIHQIQDRGKNINEAKTGMEIAISIREAIVGKHFNEGDILLVDVPKEHIEKLLTEFRSELSVDEVEILTELSKLKKLGWQL